MASRDWLDKDFYAVLGVSKDADAAEIKKAYRTIARANHPDQHPGDDAAESRFKAAGEAFRVLGDDDSRKEYDELRRLGANGGFRGGGMPAGFTAGPGGADFSDVFRMMFEQQAGGGGDVPFGFSRHQAPRQPRPAKGRDLAAKLPFDWDDALAGVTTTLGIGDEEVTVRIPAGVKDGAKIRIAGKGGPGSNNGPRGDVIVTVHVGAHDFFGRAGNDITLDVPVTYAEAALGTTLEVPLPRGGATKIRIAAGTASGSTLRIRGAGAPKARGAYGDLLMTITVVVPDDLTADQRILVEQLAELDDVTDRDRRFGRVTA